MRRLALGILTGTVAAAAVLASAGVPAQGMLRGGKYELSASPIFTQGGTYSFANGSSAKTETSAGFGIQWAYNFDEHWSSGMDGAFSGADYAGNATPGAGNPGAPFAFSTRLETITFRFNTTYHFIAAQFTPFVTLGIGATSTDTNTPTAPSSPACVWYPYWGQVCASTAPTKNLTDFSYNAGVGVRYDMRPEPYFFRALYNRLWVDLGGSTGTIDYDQIRIDFGVRF